MDKFNNLPTVSTITTTIILIFFLKKWGIFNWKKWGVFNWNLQGKRHGPRAYVAVVGEKVQRQHYIPKNQVGYIKEGIKQYRRLHEIVDLITAINLTLMRGGLLNEK